MNIGFYPGCSLNGTSREYNESVRAVTAALGLELKEIEDWNCCGATAAHSMSKELSLALPVRVLALAEQQGFSEVVVPCASCYNRLSMAAHEIAANEEVADKIRNAVGLPYSGEVKILNVLQYLDKYAADILPQKITAKFAHRVACYYGCLLVRPHKVLGFDRLEDPQSMDKLISSIGAEPIDWAFKTECCGAGLSISRTDLVGKLSANIMKDATDRGAEAIIVACPMCHSNLDLRRGAINKCLDKPTDVPVIYVTQAIGLALGLSHKELGLQRHMVKVDL